MAKDIEKETVRASWGVILRAYVSYTTGAVKAHWKLASLFISPLVGAILNGAFVDLPIPLWVWPSLGVIFLLYLPFMAFHAQYIDTQSKINQSKSKAEESSSALDTAQADNASLIESEKQARLDLKKATKSIKSLEQELENRKESMAPDIELRADLNDPSQIIATNSGSISGVISFLAGIRTADGDYLDWYQMRWTDSGGGNETLDPDTSATLRLARIQSQNDSLFGLGSSMKYDLLLLGAAHEVEGDSISIKQTPEDEDVLFATELRIVAMMSPVPNEDGLGITKEFRAKITVVGPQALISIVVQDPVI